MSLLGDIATYSNPISASTIGLYNLLNKNTNSPGGTAPRQPNNDSYAQDWQLYNKNQNNYGLGTDIASPQDYLGTINSAFSNLGQPGNDSDRQNITNNYIRSLSSSFVDRFHSQTGQTPTADQVKQFVAQNATQGNAMKFVQNQLNPDQMNALSDQYIQSNPNLAINPNQLPGQALTNQLQNYADQQYQTGVQNLQNDVQNQYIPQKQGIVEDLAAQGTLTSPNSRYSLDALEANKNKMLTQGTAQLASQRAQTGLGLGLTGAQMGQDMQKFNQQLGLANRQFANQQDVQTQNYGLMNRQIGLAGQLGQQQAAGQANNGFSGAAGGALTGAGSGAMIGSAFPGIGTAIGAGIGGLVGGLGGYFGSRR